MNNLEAILKCDLFTDFDGARVCPTSFFYQYLLQHNIYLGEDFHYWNPDVWFRWLMSECFDWENSKEKIDIKVSSDGMNWDKEKLELVYKGVPYYLDDYGFLKTSEFVKPNDGQ